MQARIGLIFLLMTVLIAACSGGEQSTPTPMPTITPEPTLTPVPTSTDTPAPTSTTEITLTPTITPTLITVQLAPGEGQPPPLNIDLPEGWAGQYYGLPIQEIDGELRVIQVAGYSGPVTDGTGFVIALWGFANLAIGNPLMGGEENLFLDGLRFWRLQIVEQGCNVGTDMQRSFTVGGLPAVGTFVSAVDCPEAVDTAGWFAALENEGVNFIFYVFTEPRAAISNDNGAPAELQSILDSVEFTVSDRLTQVALTPTVEPEPTETP